MKRDLRIVSSLAFLAVLLLFAAGGRHLAPYDPRTIDLAGSHAGPSLAHPLGQGEDGEDLLSDLIVGARTSVVVGFSVVGISLLLGVPAGLAAGYLGGALDALLVGVVDVLLAFPGILLAIAVSAVVPGGGIWRVVLALSVRGWVGYARLARAQSITLAGRPFVEALRGLGARPSRILFRHLLPNTLSPLLVEATFGLAGAIRDEAALSFLGLGVEPGTPSWGLLLDTGRQYLLVAPHIAFFPGLAVLGTVLAFNFLGDALQDRLAVT